MKWIILHSSLFFSLVVMAEDHSQGNKSIRPRKEETVKGAYYKDQFTPCGEVLPPAKKGTYQLLNVLILDVGIENGGFTPAPSGSKKSECAVIAVKPSGEVAGVVHPYLKNPDEQEARFSLVPGEALGKKEGVKYIKIGKWWVPAPCNFQTKEHIAKLSLIRPNQISDALAFINFNLKDSEDPEFFKKSSVGTEGMGEMSPDNDPASGANVGNMSPE